MVGERNSVTAAVVKGGPSETILEYADDHGVDMITMGTHGRTGLNRYMEGSVTERVVRLAEAPVLTVRATDQHDIDLITMGTTGRTGLNRYLLRITTERIIRHAEMPVLAVNAREQERN